MSGLWSGLERQWALIFLEVALIFELASGSEYCWYTHEDYGTPKQVYCESGCCRTHGEEEDICCFEWSVGVILGVCFGILVVLVTLAIVILCCYSAKKKRNKTGAVISSVHQQTYAPYYAGAAGYSFPHPPSAYYPASQFPNNPPCNSPPSPPPPATYTSGKTSNQLSIFQSTTT